MKIKGYVKPGFEHVYDQYELLVDKEYDKKSQLCVFVKGEKVVDLYRGVEPEKMTTIFSSGKSVAAILLALLHDKGLFQYEDLVDQHWPEFGKPGTTIADVMRHEAGLPKLPPMHMD